MLGGFVWDYSERVYMNGGSYMSREEKINRYVARGVELLCIALVTWSFVDYVKGGSIIGLFWASAIFIIDIISSEVFLLNKSIVDHIKKFTKELHNDKLILQNTVELIQKHFNEVYENIFGYTYKMNIFNPLLTFDKDYLIDMKVEIYTCYIFKHFKNQINDKKKNNIECSSIYQIMDIDDFNNFIVNKNNEINMNDIIEIYFSNNNKKLAKEEEIEDELMTETCYDINNVVTKESF